MRHDRKRRRRGRRVLVVHSSSSSSSSSDSVAEFEDDDDDDEDASGQSRKQSNISHKRSAQRNTTCKTCKRGTKSIETCSFCNVRKSVHVPSISSSSAHCMPALSSRKSGEFREWFNGVFSGTQPKVLVVSGPCGSGKRTALRAFCVEYSVDLCEWDAPTSVNCTQLLSSLSTFIRSASYPLLATCASNAHTHVRRMLLVDMLPLSVIFPLPAPDRALLQTLFLTHARARTNVPLVLLLSAADEMRARMQHTFVGAMLSQNFARLIRVPPVPVTCMRAALRRVNARLSEPDRLSSSLLEEIVQTACGDIRAALNAVYMHAGGVKSVPRKRQRVRIAAATTTMATADKERCLRMNGELVQYTREVGCGTFHAVSRVLNNKRGLDGTSKYDVEEILQSAGVADSPIETARIFTGYMFENYVLFFSDQGDCESAKEIANALENLCISDLFLHWHMDYLYRRLMSLCAASVATRAFLLYNKRPVQNLWRPIRAPKEYNIAQKARQYVQHSRDVLLCSHAVSPGWCLGTRDLVCDILPNMERLRGKRVVENALDSDEEEEHEEYQGNLETFYVNHVNGMHVQNAWSQESKALGNGTASQTQYAQDHGSMDNGVWQGLPPHDDQDVDVEVIEEWDSD